MRKREENNSYEQRLLNIQEASAYLGIGVSTARKYMEEIGAVRRIRNRVLYDKKAIDRALERG